jgi:hypothetical protein
MQWKPGQRVQWDTSSHGKDWPAHLTGTVADAPSWPPVDTTCQWADGERIPVDLDTPLQTRTDRLITRSYTITRLWVREQFLEAQ